MRIPTYHGDEPQDDFDDIGLPIPPGERYVAITWHQNRKEQFQLIRGNGTEEATPGSRQDAQELANNWGFVLVPPEPDENHIARWVDPKASDSPLG